MKKQPVRKAPPKKNPAPETEVSVIEKKVPATRIERTIKLVIKGTEFEMSFEEAIKLSDEIRKATGTSENDFLKKLRDSMGKRPPADIDEPMVPTRPRQPFIPRPPRPDYPWPYDRPPIWY